MKEITSKDEFDNVVKMTGKLVVVEFGAEWCGPCKMITPAFKKLGEEYGEKIYCAKVDVDDAEDVAEGCEIACMPTFHFYRDGVKIEEMKGANKDNLHKIVKQLIEDGVAQQTTVKQ